MKLQTKDEILTYISNSTQFECDESFAIIKVIMITDSGQLGFLHQIISWKWNIYDDSENDNVEITVKSLIMGESERSEHGT